MPVNLRRLGVLSIVLLPLAGDCAAAADLPLIEAVKNGDAAAVSLLLKQHADVNAPAGDGGTALHWAVHLNDVTMVDRLIRAGARVNAANDMAVTPLYLACTNRSAVMIQKLLSSG